MKLIRLVRNKNGAMVLYFTMMMAMLFPLIMFSIIDLSNMYRISKEMSISLNAAAKSASSRIDFQRLPSGEIYIDTPRAVNAFHDIFDANLGIESSDQGGGLSRFTRSDGNTIQSYIYIYNARHEGTFQAYPAAGTIPSTLYDKNLQAFTDRPAVFGIASYEYTTSNVFGSRKKVRIIRFAAAQLNFIPQDKQPSAQ